MSNNYLDYRLDNRYPTSMEKQLLHHIDNFKSHLDKEGKLGKIKDMLSFQISITYIDNAIKKKLLTKKEFLKLVRGRK